jgi:hypothetical protein
MKRIGLTVMSAFAMLGGCGGDNDNNSASLIDQGRGIFRFETFGDEEFWTDKARLHEVIEQSVSPAMALKVGLKVDADAIPPDVAAAIKGGKVDLESPATTVTLLKLNAVVGLQGTVKPRTGRIASFGSASRARFATRPSTIRFRRGSGTAGTGGPTATSTSAPSSRCLQPSRPSRRRSTTPGGPASTIPATTSTGRALRWYSLQRMASQR